MKRDDLDSLARIVDLMHTTPNARRVPRAGDLEGDFDVWFDGGGAKHMTGISTYKFADGSAASVTTALNWPETISLANGCRVSVTYRPEP